MKKMNYKAAILLLACALVSCSRHEELPAPDRPRLTSAVKMIDVTFHSGALNRDMQYRADDTSEHRTQTRSFLCCICFMAAEADFVTGRITLMSLAMLSVA